MLQFNNSTEQCGNPDDAADNAVRLSLLEGYFVLSPIWSLYAKKVLQSLYHSLEGVTAEMSRLTMRGSSSSKNDIKESVGSPILHSNSLHNERVERTKKLKRAVKSISPDEMAASAFGHFAKQRQKR